MYKTRKNVVLISVTVVSIICFLLMSLSLLPVRNSIEMPVVTGVVVMLVFATIIFWSNRVRNVLLTRVRKDTLESGETVIINNFIDKLRFCYSVDDFYLAISDVLEKQGDCSVLFIDRVKNYTLYNSPNRISTSESIRAKLDQNFTESWNDGNFFFDRHIGVTTNYKKARGFFLCYDKVHFYVFCRYTRLFDLAVYSRLFEEYKRFISRTRTITTLSEISATTKEWEQLAVTQQSFLPQKIPNIPKLKLQHISDLL